MTRDRRARLAALALALDGRWGDSALAHDRLALKARSPVNLGFGNRARRSGARESNA